MGSDLLKKPGLERTTVGEPLQSVKIEDVLNKNDSATKQKEDLSKLGKPKSVRVNEVTNFKIKTLIQMKIAKSGDTLIDEIIDSYVEKELDEEKRKKFKEQLNFFKTNILS